MRRSVDRAASPSREPSPLTGEAASRTAIETEVEPGYGGVQRWMRAGGNVAFHALTRAPRAETVASRADHATPQAAATTDAGSGAVGQDGDCESLPRGRDEASMTSPQAAPRGRPQETAGEGTSHADPRVGFAGVVRWGFPPRAKDEGFAFGKAIPNLDGFVAPTIELRPLRSTDRPEGDERVALRLERTHSVDAVHEAWATPAGLYEFQPGRRSEEEVGWTFVMEVSSEIAAQIMAAEQEHLDDYRHAYRLTLELVRDRVNFLAARPAGFEGATSEEAEEAAHQALEPLVPEPLHGIYRSPELLIRAVRNLIQLSNFRRDRDGAHEFVPEESPHRTNDRTREMFFLVVPGPRNRVGQVPSSALITVRDVL